MTQAQGKTSRLDEDDEKRYRQKMMLKAEIIIGAANRLWGKKKGENSHELPWVSKLTGDRTSAAS